MKKMSVKKLFGFLAKIIVGAVVAAFLGMRSIDFFNFVTPAEESYYSWLGFGLTGGGMIAYLLIFMTDADTSLKKFISIGMLAVCTLGELVTAGYGLQIDAWKKAGFALTETDFTAMIRAVQLLALLHAVALIAYLAGDKLAEAFGDEDGDGIPNAFDRDYKSKRQEAPRAPHGSPITVNASDTKAEAMETDPNAPRGGKN